MLVPLSMGQPFFMYFNPTVIHSSNSITDALTDFSCKDTANGTLDSEPVIPGMTGDKDCATYRQSIFDRAEEDEDLGAIWLDDSVGALLTALKDTGKLENTIFLFQEDHGINPKATLYEGGIRIPQFIHYPAVIKAGIQFDEPVSVLDIAPTMLDFAGIASSYKMDGLSWKPAILNEESSSDWNGRCLYFELQKDRAVRCGCYKYLSIFEQDGDVSTTYQRGSRMGLANDETNLFDLCDQSNNYVAETNRNSMEATDVINMEPDTASNFATLLECHLERIESADFSQCQLSTPASGPDSASSLQKLNIFTSVYVFIVAYLLYFV